MEIHAHDREGKTKPPPIGEIIRNAAGKPIGRVLRLAPCVAAYGRGDWIGDFANEQAAIQAIRASHEARP